MPEVEAVAGVVINAHSRYAKILWEAHTGSLITTAPGTLVLNGSTGLTSQVAPWTLTAQEKLLKGSATPASVKVLACVPLASYSMLMWPLTSLMLSPGDPFLRQLL